MQSLVVQGYCCWGGALLRKERKGAGKREHQLNGNKFWWRPLPKSVFIITQEKVCGTRVWEFIWWVQKIQHFTLKWLTSQIQCIYTDLLTAPTLHVFHVLLFLETICRPLCIHFSNLVIYQVFLLTHTLGIRYLNNYIQSSISSWWSQSDFCPCTHIGLKGRILFFLEDFFPLHILCYVCLNYFSCRRLF